MNKFDALAQSTVSLMLRGTLLMLLAAGSFGCQQLPDEPMVRGELVYNNCAACHGDQGEGKVEYEAPSIAGLGSWYVKNQLTKYREGYRGAHADDVEGLRMRPLSKTLRTEADVDAVSAYVAQLPAVINSPKTIMDGDPGRGADYYKTCVACHGADGSGMEALSAPSLIVTPDWYQLRQLKKFKSGVRGRAEGDVTGAQMSAMITVLPDEQAMKDVVAYIQKLKRPTPPMARE